MDFKAQQLAVRRNSGWAILVYLATATGSVAFLPSILNLPVDDLSHLILAIQASLPQLVWMLVGVGLVSRGRLNSKSDIDGSASGPPSPKLALRVAFLQNTLEQAVISIVANLVLAATAPGRWLVLALLAGFLFTVGRVAFYRGYPSGAPGRAFGMSLTILPAIGQIAVSLYFLADRLFR